MEIFKEFSLEVAHRLPNVPQGHKCRELHGHTFRVVIHLEGDVNDASGWVEDFASIKEAFKPVSEQLDHHFLNEVEGLSNPTCENIAIWIWKRLRARLPLLSKVVVWETATSGCLYRGGAR